MADVLYLVHRIPYPPNKGDKVRSYHLLKALAARHRVFLGTFVDDPADERFVDEVRRYCVDVHATRLSPTWARVRSLAGLIQGKPLTLGYYQDGALSNWVRRLVDERGIRHAIAFSTAMAQYALRHAELRVLIDCVDVDSAKWTQYAGSRPWPVSWIYRREGRLLLAYEAEAVGRSAAAFFVTDAERALFSSLAPQCESRIATAGNGVDADFFSPMHESTSPFQADEHTVVFTGAMDYWPNADAARWFATEVLPMLKQDWPKLRFYIVGMRPSASVLALASENVVVTGTVPDVRPYLRHAGVVVAPLRIARGIQNKVLEAMAMGKAVVASAACAVGIAAQRGNEIEIADSAEEFARRIDALLRDQIRAAKIGRGARNRVLAAYSWDAHLAGIVATVDASGADSGRAAPALATPLIVNHAPT